MRARRRCSGHDPCQRNDISFQSCSTLTCSIGKTLPGKTLGVRVDESVRSAVASVPSQLSTSPRCCHAGWRLPGLGLQAHRHQSPAQERPCRRRRSFHAVLCHRRPSLLDHPMRGARGHHTTTEDVVDTHQYFDPRRWPSVRRRRRHHRPGVDFTSIANVLRETCETLTVFLLGPSDSHLCCVSARLTTRTDGRIGRVRTNRARFVNRTCLASTDAEGRPSKPCLSANWSDSGPSKEQRARKSVNARHVLAGTPDPPFSGRRCQ